MTRRILDDTIKDQLTECADKLEDEFDGNVISYTGQIHPTYLKTFRNFIEHVVDKDKKDRVIIFLQTPGGSVETVEKMVQIVRHHYDSVYFVVPDAAMSAGTIFCMSGDKVYMDYSSSLGPIDPQVLVNHGQGEQYVPALGYLDQVERFIEKSLGGKLSPAEFAILQNQDLALLRRYEQARDLSIDLLKSWLVTYKFSNWTVHRTDPGKVGNAVTPAEKEARAEEIAIKLGNNKKWHSHGIMIGVETLKADLKLEIEDYSADKNLQKLIRVYNDLLSEYVRQEQYSFFLHNKTYF